MTAMRPFNELKPDFSKKPETVEKSQAELLGFLSHAIGACDAAVDKCHEYGNTNNLPNARMASTAALIGSALGNLRMVRAKLTKEGLPTE